MEHLGGINLNKLFINIIIILFLAIMFLFVIPQMGSAIIAMILLNMIIVFILPFKDLFSKILGFLYSLLLLLFVQGNWIEFEFFLQAYKLLIDNTDLLHWFSEGDVHAIRLLIAYPGYIISKVFAIELNIGFSYYCVTMFTVMYLIIIDTVLKFKKSRLRYDSETKMFFALIPFLILPFIMNGRLIAAFLGFSILIHLFVALFHGQSRMGSIKKFLIGCLGLVLTMVSSGTMSVALVYCLFSVYVLNYKQIKKIKFIKKALLTLVVISPVIYIVLSYFWQMLIKNINFFGGGIEGFINMFSHGAGRLLILNGPGLIITLIAGAVFVLLNMVYLRNAIITKYRYIPILAGINISLYGLLFGFSTGLMMIPPLILLILLSI